MALGLARAGANVMITAARNQHELDAVEQAAANEQAGAIHTMLADAASEDDSLRVVDRTIREFGAVHILVNNAGRGMRFVSERFFRYTDSLLAN